MCWDEKNLISKGKITKERNKINLIGDIVKVYIRIIKINNFNNNNK